jgi:hypothetical protein
MWFLILTDIWIFHNSTKIPHMADHNSLNFSPSATNDEAARLVKHNGIGKPTHSQAMAAAAMVGSTFVADQQNVGAAAMLANYNLPAGYTYLGQFITHDIGAMLNLGFQEPTLSLLSLYGMGPSAAPDLYVHYPQDLGNPAMDCAYRADDEYACFRHAKMRLLHEGSDQYDVPRMGNKMAVMADARNDQNFLLNQIHCAFVRFHNALVEWLQYVSHTCRLIQKANVVELKGEPLFGLARSLAIYYYQRLILEDYLPKLVGQTLVDDLWLHSNFKLFDPTQPVRLMPEFRLAAMRVGHSQVQEIYLLNTKEQRAAIFEESSNGKAAPVDLGGFKAHEYFGFEWSVFFDLNGPGTAQLSAAINHQIAYPLSQLRFRPRGDQNLPSINTGHSDQLPFGLELAKALGVAKPVSQAHLDKIFAGHAPQNIPQIDALPLWPYILLEAEIQHGGQRLGELGGRIVAEQIIWVLKQGGLNLASVKTMATQLFQEFSGLKSNFLDASVLAKALEGAGFGAEKISMNDLLEFPNRVKRQAADVQKEARALMGPIGIHHQSGPVGRESLLDVIRSKSRQ